MSEQTLLSEKHGYRFVQTYRQLTEELAQKITNMWQSNRALPQGVDPQQRLHEVLVAAINSDNEVVGVNSGQLIIGQRGELRGKRLCNMRQFIRPQDRGYPLHSELSRCGRGIIRQCGEFDAILIVPENRKYAGTGNQKRLQRLGFQFFAQGNFWLQLFT